MDAIYLSFPYTCFSDYYDKHDNNLDSSTSSKYAICMSRSRSWVPIQWAKRENTNPIGTNLCVHGRVGPLVKGVILLDNGVLRRNNGSFNEGNTKSHKEVQNKIIIPNRVR